LNTNNLRIYKFKGWQCTF